MKTTKCKFPEQMLIQLLREQHPNGARALYDMYSPALLSVIFRIMNDQALSEDILQETFIKIWQSTDRYDCNKGRLFTWIVNIARNLAIDRLRSKCYRYGHQTDDIDDCDELLLPTYEQQNVTDLHFIRQGVAKLRRNELDIINLIYYQGYTHAEAAETLNIPLGTVKTRLTMALKRLRIYYADTNLAIAS